MIAVVQRVKEAGVTVNDELISNISVGFMVLLGCRKGDTDKDAEYIAKKISGLRVFSDSEDKMNLDICQANGSVLLVSQFTLLAQTRKGNRPSFTDAESPERANELYMIVKNIIEDKGIEVKTGVFGAMMQVSLVNDGPVTIILDSKDLIK